MIVGIVFRLSSFLMQVRTSRPSIFGRFKSSRIKSGRGALAWTPSRLRKAMASTPSMATCKRTVLSKSLKASRVNRTSPGLSSTRSTSLSISSLSGPVVRLLAQPATDLQRQFGPHQPKVTDALHECLKSFELHGLAEVAVRLKLIAFQNIRFRLGRGQYDRR